ncbi:imelysin family protein [Ramlibacter tataouinensis]|uniref:Imelysin-like domain-containing protein n=1 Tax=Ramlibacter tataouinensis (strain ATCC BAA-407 / DSM 14655 / LMG 21543 / TTB310) TaxID=365046 RepID=F5Y1U3_RAMTT|nr:imelysin family protein [Ramlibacter tataouinensis]AEG93527.1 Conserved hypothetical protein [Ramlibacter tataouinensis TTB310]
MNRRVLTRRAAVALLAAGGAALAQQVPGNVAVPFYTPADFLRGMHRFWFAPRAQAFAAEALALRAALAPSCATPAQARERWKAAALAWERLSGVAVGPLLQRRSQRQIDFAPVRPELIARAIRGEPADLRALERVGTPAKGLGTLEWLLWTRPAAPGSAECRYAQLLAQEVEAEALALREAFDALAARDWGAEPEAAGAAMAEAVNQWVGAQERLRWAQMERPLRSARDGSAPGRPPAWPRAASGSSAASWSARWEAIAALAALPGRAAPQPGAGLVPLETYLRGRGLNPLADRLARTAAQAGRGMAAARPGATGSVQTAARAVGELKRLAEAEIAPALEVQIGFSDADGD